MIVYTSITKSYLPKARVLANSLKRFHPEWTFILLFSDSLPSDFILANEPFDEVLTIEMLPLKRDWQSWAFGHSIVELCTAVKGPAAELIAGRAGVDKIMYLDPDICVYNSLRELEELLDKHDILLTPHILNAEVELSAIMDNEISALKHGVYNLGFFAARTDGQGIQFIKWWSNRLINFCEDDIPSGLFTDQRWCDLAPAFFSNLYIVRDAGYNVATWNIAHRPLSKTMEGEYTVGNVPLRFYHFTSYDNGNGLGMLQKYASDQKYAHELWSNYGAALAEQGQKNRQYSSWQLGFFDNNEIIPKEARRLYRKNPGLQNKFPNPYSSGGLSYMSWFAKNGQKFSSIKASGANSLINRINSIEKISYLLKRILFITKNEGIAGLLKRIRRVWDTLNNGV